METPQISDGGRSGIIMSARAELHRRFRAKLQVNHDLDRSLVSFQANKKMPFGRWFKYREGFSADLVRYVLQYFNARSGQTLLDPFSGAGTALFEGVGRGLKCLGMEVLPVGAFVTECRLAALKVEKSTLAAAVSQIKAQAFVKSDNAKFRFRHINITKGAFSEKNENEIASYLTFVHREHGGEPDLINILRFAAFAVLEDASFTRKDGQFIRWDHRSGRSSKKSLFNKGQIHSFKEAVLAKLDQFLGDWSDEEAGDKINQAAASLKVIHGSCLRELPTLEASSIDFVITSPPYCNRYDYTRTYALELAFLGCDDEEVKRLRQKMLSCTVENREKLQDMAKYYQSLEQIETFNAAMEAFASERALQLILAKLDLAAKAGELNNPNIAKMVRNYFIEMTFVIAGFARVLKQGGKVAMVNDNVQYLGEEIPVDLILSSLAEKFSLHTEVIWVLPKGKGNSSQQMGKHGRRELRKCIYVWRKK